MPLPKALKPGAAKSKVKARASEVMDELTHGPVNSPSRKATSGKQREKQNLAIMLQNTGQSNKKKKSGK